MIFVIFVNLYAVATQGINQGHSPTAEVHVKRDPENFCSHPIATTDCPLGHTPIHNWGAMNGDLALRLASCQNLIPEIQNQSMQVVSGISNSFTNRGFPLPER